MNSRPSQQRAILYGLRAAVCLLALWIPLLTWQLTSSGAPRVETLGWQSLDIAELVSLAVTVRCAHLEHSWTRWAATTSAALFGLDAIVDVTTSAAAPSELLESILMAACAEIPLMIACLTLRTHHETKASRSLTAAAL